MGLTQEVANFVFKTRYRDIPEDVVQLARGFILDGFGVALAGSTDECSRIVQAHIRQMAGKGEATVLGTKLSAPTPKAALANGVAGHAMDYDDTQLSTSKEAVYGLLTHPTTPVLAAVLAVGEKERVSGEDFVLAYLLRSQEGVKSFVGNFGGWRPPGPETLHRTPSCSSLRDMPNPRPHSSPSQTVARSPGV